MIVAIWWLFVIVVATTYSGNLVACLTFPKVYQPIQTAQDLLNGWFMTWATQVGSPLQEVTRTEEYQPIALLRPKMQYWNYDSNKHYIIEEAAHDSLAWIGMDEFVRHTVSVDYLNGGVCRLHKSKEDVYRAPVYFAFNKAIEPNMIRAINHQLMELGMAGFIVHWMKYYEQLGNDCLQPTLVYAGDVRKIELLHMYGSYVILGLGVTTSFIVFLMEVAFWKMIRPCLPEKWKVSNASAMDYYNKIFIGYGYSNIRTMSPTKKKLPKSKQAGAATKGSNIASNNNNNLVAENSKAALAQVVSGGASSGVTPTRESSASSRTELYDSGNSSYNTRAHYNYYNYGTTKGNFRTRFGMQ
jgi:hypothetical protein